jgi:DNA polymerase-3 subunit gamma/tau
MASDIFGDTHPQDPPDEALPEPPAPDGPGLFGKPAAPAVAVGPAPAVPPVVAPPAVVEQAAPYRVLARKYRPKTFAELIGQEALVRTLRNAFAQGRVHHAFMLTGVRGVGKTTTARIIARALNCVGPDGTGGPTPEPCGACAECRAILADRHPDVQELDAASNNGVDDVRELRERLRFRPAQGRFKVIILDEVHMLSSAAFNALLKTLEEPPPDVKFMLATTELRKVPTTILSRCQTFHLRRVPQEVLRAHFARICAEEGVAAEEEALAMVARAADGSVRDGLSILDQGIAQGGSSAGGGAVTAEAVREMLGLADRGLALSVMEALMAGEAARALTLAEEAHARGTDPGVMLAELLELTHLLSRLKSIPALRRDAALTEAERGRGAELADRLSIPVLARAWQMLLKGLQEVAQDGVDRRAAAEMVLIRLAHVAELPTPGDLVRRLTEGGAAAPAATAPAGPAAPAGGGLRAVAGGGTVVPAPAALPAAAPAPAPASWREVVALTSGREPRLHAELRSFGHPVRVAPGQVEFRPAEGAPRDLSQRLAAFLLEATGTRWTIALASAGGEPTLTQQGRTAEADRLALAQAHPLVQAVLAAFPGASIEAVRDASLDDYGLPPPDSGRDFAMPGSGRDFAPPEAEPAGPDDDLSQED